MLKLETWRDKIFASNGNSIPIDKMDAAILKLLRSEPSNAVALLMEAIVVREGKKFFEAKTIRYNGETTLVASFSANSSSAPTYTITISSQKAGAAVVARFVLTMKQKLTDMAWRNHGLKMVAIANYGLPTGSFQCDPRDGELKFESAFPMVVDPDSLQTALRTFFALSYRNIERYLPVFHRLLAHDPSWQSRLSEIEGDFMPTLTPALSLPDEFLHALQIYLSSRRVTFTTRDQKLQGATSANAIELAFSAKIKHDLSAHLVIELQAVHGDMKKLGTSRNRRMTRLVAEMNAENATVGTILYDVRDGEIKFRAQIIVVPTPDDKLPRLVGGTFSNAVAYFSRALVRVQQLLHDPDVVDTSRPQGHSEPVPRPNVMPASQPAPSSRRRAESAEPTSTTSRVDRHLRSTEVEIFQDAILGRGGFGVVHRGRYNYAEVAVKIAYESSSSTDMGREQDAGFANEVKLHSQLNHPNIVTVYGAFQDPDRKWMLVLDYCEGGTLAKYIDRNRTSIDMVQTIRYALQIAQGMAYLHDQQIIHADLKPQNVLLSSNIAKVSDFGFAKRLTNSLSRVSMRGGTYLYMAPEVLETEQVSKSADVYAYALIMYELFTGSIPFEGWSDRRREREVINGTRPQIDETRVPHELSDLIRRCWDHDARSRRTFPSCVDILNRIS